MEIELKVPDVDLEGVEELLSRKGAAFLREVEQMDSYLQHPCRDFGSTDEALRIREVDGETILTYKGPKVDAETKSREEREVALPSREGMETILRSLGFARVMEVRKTRRSYMLGEVEIALDRVDGLGDFVELEYKGGDPGPGRESILSLKDELGLRGNERRSYMELLMER
ncbi:MAG: class IV adenylate cyclase [Methanomassiliicoccales archaeon]